MRFVLAFSILLASASTTMAQTLHAVHFVDAKEGWTAGDDGVIQHTIDGGKTWEPQTSGTKASLRSIAFLDESTGWIVGRHEKPYGGGSVGVVLFTRDGGIKWQPLLDAALPGLNAVRFTDPKTGFLLGDGQDPFASGLFRTTDGGKTWDPVQGTRTPAWAAADFQDAERGLLVGPYGKLATYNKGQWAFADPAIFGGRGLRAVQILNKRQIAVGEGGLVLTSTSAGSAWGHADLGIPPEARACLDFNAIASVDNRVWIAGRPGSVIFRSDDGGVTWAVKKVRPESGSARVGALPLHALHFVDKNNGWAVGAAGTILTTTDGGDTWIEANPKLPPAVMFVHAQAQAVPLDAIAHVRSECRSSVALAVTTEGLHGSPDGRMTDRLHTAARFVGASAGEELSGFPLPQYLQASSKDELMNAWNGVHGGKAPQELLRHLVLALRTWQANVVITDDPNGPFAGGLIAEAVAEAVKRADNPKEFPEQIDILGLRPTENSSLFACVEKGTISIDTSREIASVGQGFLGDRPQELPLQRSFQFVGFGANALVKSPDLAKSLPGLMSGTVASWPGALPGTHDRVSRQEATKKAMRQVINLVDKLPRSEIALAQLVPALKALPEDDAARAAFTVANTYVRMGEWDLARETFLLMVDRSPTHPLSAEAYRWLVQHNVSSEVRRRYELGQFAIVNPENSLRYTIAQSATGDIKQASAVETAADLFPPFEKTKEIRQWARGAGEFNKRFALFGSLAMTDPRTQFSVQAARRKLGEIGAAAAWHQKFATHVVKGPWAEAAAAEVWIAGMGPRPKRVAGCRFTDERPTLDGKLDDACWKGQIPMTLSDASGTSQAENPTEAWLAYDAEFLYVAVRCKHPVGRAAAPMKVRQRDANLDGHDHVSLLLDLDRDYATYFRLEFDQRGCVREDCWGDANWNPKWYVAAHQNDDSWCVEAAIPLGELTSSPVTLDTRWACNLVRILPGRGVQSVSQPADVEPRPEGMCVLQFYQDARRVAPPMSPAP